MRKSALQGSWTPALEEIPPLCLRLIHATHFLHMVPPHLGLHPVAACDKLCSTP